MIKPRLFLKVLGIFGLLIVMITVMTVLTLDVFNQVEKNFTLASSEIGFLNDLERLRHYLSDMPTAVDVYMITGANDALAAYQNGAGEFDVIVRNLTRYELDSVSVNSLKEVKDLYYLWRRDVGDKKISLGKMRGDRNIDKDLQVLIRQESEKAYLSHARSLVRELYRDKMTSQPKRIQIATNLLRGVATFIGFLNITLAFFAIVLGFVLTRSITKPVHLLTEGTRNIMSGKFETINLKRSDELGQLANDFNKMSIILRNNYNRLNAYSELVTALNTSTVEETVEQSSLELMCHHVDASVGALYLFDAKNRHTLELAAGYGLRRGDRTKTFALGEGIPGQCAREKKMLEINNIAETSAFAIDTGFVTVAPRYVIAVPVIFQEEVLGTIVLGSMNPFDELKKEILTNSAPQVGIAVTNVRNVEATHKLSQEIAGKNEELNAKNVELEKAYKVKSDFLSSMSHELRTPLNSIIGFTSILLGPQGDPLTQDQKKALEKVLRNGKHLLQLINDILDFSKIEAGRMPINIETDEVESVVASALATVESLIKSKNLQLEQSISSDLPTLHTDILKIKQILVNLLSNAAKFTDQGKVAIRVGRMNGMLRFEVEDSGIGIDKKNLDLVFQEFQQIDSSSTRKYQGTGLGLPISRRLARMLGGDLRVDSEFGKGSTFTLVVPPVFPEELKSEYVISAPVTQPPARKEKKTDTPLPGKALILCIDDDPDVLEILRKYLVPEGYSVVTATSGDEGIEAALKHKPHVITLDIMMPHKDGWQVLQELKQNAATKDIPVLIHSMIDNKPLAISLGAQDVLPKPVDASQLLSIVKKVSRSDKEFVLLVDDSEDFCDVVKTVLEADGIPAKVAYNGKQALEIIKKDIPALILLDLMMPVMDGFQLMREMQDNDHWKDIPVVIVSAREITAEELQDLNKRIVDYMHKRDFSREALSKTVNRILGRS
jgi:signal transduction histidine kinase/CheY-like chemotaxis protein/CHASE3 domain sensor protein